MSAFLLDLMIVFPIRLPRRSKRCNANINKNMPPELRSNIFSTSDILLSTDSIRVESEQTTFHSLVKNHIWIDDVLG